MRYYSTQRPIGPGAFPRQDGTESIVNFDGPTYCEEIGREAWGYIDYQQALDPNECSRYELTPGGTEGHVLLGTDKKGRQVAFIPDTHAADAVEERNSQIYGVWAVRSTASMFGHAEAWCKDDGRPLEFESKESAQAYAQELNRKATANVSYFVKEKEPEPNAVRVPASQPKEWTRNELAIDPYMDVDPDLGTVTAYVETWFDPDQKFGLHIVEEENTWVNLYATYCPDTKELSVAYVISRENGDEQRSYDPTPNEKKLLVSMMEETCQKVNGLSLNDYVEDVRKLEADDLEL